MGLVGKGMKGQKEGGGMGMKGCRGEKIRARET